MSKRTIVEHFAHGLSMKDHTSGTLKCPNCGGDAKPDDVRCSWCQSSLATIACPSCFATIFAGMKHCPWCGAAVSSAEELEQPAGSCPRCEVAMTPLHLGGSRLNECRSCGGLWVNRETFEGICQDREQQEAVLGQPAFQEVDESTKRPKRLYIPCPSCKKLMNRMNFAGCSGIIVDWCKEHGTWLDHSELPQIIAFIREGGLRRAREREKEGLRAESRRLRMKEIKLASQQAKAPGERLSLSWSDEPDSVLSFLSSLWNGLP